MGGHVSNSPSRHGASGHISSVRDGAASVRAASVHWSGEEGSPSGYSSHHCAAHHVSSLGAGAGAGFGGGNNMRIGEPGVDMVTTGGTTSPPKYEPPPALPSRSPNMLGNGCIGTTFLKSKIKVVVQQKMYDDPLGRAVQFKSCTNGKTLESGKRGIGYSYWRCIMHQRCGCPYLLTFTIIDSIRPFMEENAKHSIYHHSNDCALFHQQYLDNLTKEGKHPRRRGPALARLVISLCVSLQ